MKSTIVYISCNLLVFLFAAIFLISSENKSTLEKADTILTNGRIYTFSWPDPSTNGTPSNLAPYTNGRWKHDAEALAIKEGKIIFVGSDKEVQQYMGDSTKRLDLKGATIFPGFVESHTHIQQLGEWHEEVALRGLHSSEEIIASVYEKSLIIPKGEWIIGSGWDEAEFTNNYPDMNLLSEKVPDHPVMLNGLRGFGLLGNRAAFEKAGITRDTPIPSGGEILKDENGEPSGVLLNNAKGLLRSIVPERNMEQKKRIIEYGLSELAISGYVAVHHAGVRADYMGVYETLAEENKIPIRLHAMIAATKPNLELVRKWIQNGPTSDPNAMLQIRSFKAFYDGSLGSRGAKMIEEYSDSPGHTGVSGMEYGFDSTLVKEVISAGFQVAIHAIGDQGNRDVLDFFASTFSRSPKAKELRHRIEHAQIVHQEDFPRFGTLNIIASMEPAHVIEDMPWAPDRIGHERIKGAYAWRTIRQSGAKIIFNSDLAGTDHNLFYGLHSAVTRRNKNQEPKNGWSPEQCLTIEEAIRAYTSWVAYACKQEELTGTLETGKWADITVMDIDPMTITKEESAKLLDGQILMTIVNGNIVYNKVSGD
ncbi:amidohydrolase [Fulvivirgaceae bacterium BMA10]|uniref:Amidohydrolase n=1 Tax=Splendidivirga corallicola TaxID=3051826 RepID=A0ABT8KL60_9BACT|nr:amidohydrolase [Fulvivirgaceae bacterium BMA10]